jgi:hypothetical protein
MRRGIDRSVGCNVRHLHLDATQSQVQTHLPHTDSNAPKAPCGALTQPHLSRLLLILNAAAIPEEVIRHRKPRSGRGGRCGKRGWGTIAKLQRAGRGEGTAVRRVVSEKTPRRGGRSRDSGAADENSLSGAVRGGGEIEGVDGRGHQGGYHQEHNAARRE